jgi:hypothetical protein
MSAHYVVLRTGSGDDDFLRASGYSLLRPSDYHVLRSDGRLLSKVGVLRPNDGILRRQWILRRLQSRWIVRHWRGRLGRCSGRQPQMGSSRVVNGENVAACSFSGIERRGYARDSAPSVNAVCHANPPAATIGRTPLPRSSPVAEYAAGKSTEPGKRTAVMWSRSRSPPPT